jgi:hypothetical protein
MLSDEIPQLTQLTEDELSEMDKETLKAEIAILEGKFFFSHDLSHDRKHSKCQS